MMTFRKGVPSYIALPIAAFVTYLLQLIYYSQALIDVNASVVSGLLTTWTPILILWGAIFLFKTMEVGGALHEIKRGLNQVSTHPVAQLMIVGWAFSFFIEGISGFGTPAALAAPLLTGFGFPAFPVVLFCLALNTIPVTFGAVGTPIWFGLGELNLSESALAAISLKTALIQTCAALVIPVIALRFLISWDVIRKNIIFIYLSLLATVIPYTLFSLVNAEFPSIFGGICGLLLSIFFAKKKWGLADTNTDTRETSDRMNAAQIFKALFPLSAAVLLLAVTRIPGLGLKALLTQGADWINVSVPLLGNMTVSSSLVVAIPQIFGTATGWKHPLLYIPSILPFGFVCVLCFFIFKFSKDQVGHVWHDTIQRLVKPFVALMGAMVFVKLFMLGGESAPVLILGQAIADTAGGFWRWASVYLGALGSFFAGSATVSNLTFGGIQNAFAERLNIDASMVLSLQAVGGAMGNMACIHNIVAVCAVLGLEKQEGTILKKIFPVLILYGAIAGFAAWLLGGLL